MREMWIVGIKREGGGGGGDGKIVMLHSYRKLHMMGQFSVCLFPRFILSNLMRLGQKHSLGREEKALVRASYVYFITSWFSASRF